MNHSLFIAIDVSRASNTVAIHSTNGDLAEPVFTIANNQDGVETLIEKLHRYLTETPALHVLIGCEATGIYSFHLLQALANAERLASFDVTLYHLHPFVCICAGHQRLQYRGFELQSQLKNLPLINQKGRG